MPFTVGFFNSSHKKEGGMNEKKGNLDRVDLFATGIDAFSFMLHSDIGNNTAPDHHVDHFGHHYRLQNDTHHNPSNTTSTTTTTGSTAHWWDKLGAPQYGGQLTISLPSNVGNWDTYYNPGQVTIWQAYLDRLTTDDWTVDPSIFSYQLNFRPAIG